MTTAEPSAFVTTGSHWGVYRAEVRGGRLVGIEPFAEDQEPSPLIAGMADIVYDQTRIDRPMVRAGYLEHGIAGDRGGRGHEPFVPVSWDRALDLVAGELKRVRSSHGNEAIFGSSGWGSAGTFNGPRGQLTRFLNGFGGFVDQVGNYSFGAATVILPHVVGTLQPVVGPLTAWPTIAEHTQLMVMFGGMAPKNAQVNLGGLGSHDTMGWLRKAGKAGVDFVVISPLRDDAADFLDAEWLPARPNTDTALMLALAHTLVAEGLHDETFLARYCVGFARFRAYLLGETDGQPKDAEWAAAIVELEAEAIRALARRMAGHRTMIAVSWSVQRADHGEQPYWMAITLAAMLGQIGLPGGGVGFGYGANGGTGTPRPKYPLPSLPAGENPTKAFIPVARITDMLLDPGGTLDFNGQRIVYPDIRLMYWCGGNPFHKQQDINRLLRAWRKPETIIVHEPWWTPAARRADIVLPVTTTLERNDIGASRSDRFLIAMHKAIEPVGEARNDYDVFADLAGRLGFREAFTEGRNEMEWLRHMYDLARQQAARQGIEMPGFDAFRETGFFEVPPPADPPVLFAEYRRDPDASPLRTPSGRIEIFSETIAGFGYDDCPGHPAWLEPAEWLGSPTARTHPLHMISNQPRHRLHSQMDPGPLSRAGKVRGREPVVIHPGDAAERGIGDGDVVRVFNDRGACLAGAVISDSVRPGVVQMATGGWYDPVETDGPGALDRPLDRQGNPNVLTLDKGTSKLAQTCAAQTALVEIERHDGHAPEVAVYGPPAIDRGARS